MYKSAHNFATVIACVAVAACSTMPAPSTNTDLEQLYESAIFDAAVYNPSHEALLRSVNGSVALVVTWVPAEDAELDYPLGPLILRRETWVTVDGDVRQRCHAYARNTESELTTRLQQLLGLEPASESRVFVTMRAPTAKIFRPCLNPDVSQPTCDRREFPSNASQEHRAWVAGQMVVSYQIRTSGGKPSGHPWTALGYTYDWAPQSNHVGPSEYVVEAGAPVTVVAKEISSDYCAP